MRFAKRFSAGMFVVVCAGISSARAGEEVLNQAFYDRKSKKEVHLCRTGADGSLLVAETCNGFPTLETRQREDLIATVEEINGLKVGGSRGLALTGKPARWVYSKIFEAWEDGSVLIVEKDQSRLFPKPNQKFIVHSSQLIPEVDSLGGVHKDESYCLQRGGYENFSRGQRLKVVSVFKNGLVGVKTDFWGDRIWPSDSEAGVVLATDLRPCGETVQVSERRLKRPAEDTGAVSESASASSPEGAASAR